MNPSYGVCTEQDAREFQRDFDSVVAEVGKAVVGKTEVVRFAMTCFFSGLHVLLEDVPGVGKTLLAKSIARAFHGGHKRIQFTPDLLPSDITGGEIYNLRSGERSVEEGPIFTNILLADEINRASPKTQSALLQAMEEGQVTIRGADRDLPRPFMVIATQNPIEQQGTYRLPEAQLDRFGMRLSLGHTDASTTARLLTERVPPGVGKDRGRIGLVNAAIEANTANERIALVRSVYIADPVAHFVVALAEASREAHGVKLGVSARGCERLASAAKTWAAAQGRNHVLADDVLRLVGPVFTHRLVIDPESEQEGVSAAGVIEDIAKRIDPRDFGAY